VNEPEEDFPAIFFAAIELIGLEQAPNLALPSLTERGNLVWLPAKGKLTVKLTDSCASLGSGESECHVVTTWISV
jgi:hypothetical protein